MEIEKTVTRDNLIKSEISLNLWLYCKSQTTQCQENYVSEYYKEKLQLRISHNTSWGWNRNSRMIWTWEPVKCANFWYEIALKIGHLEDTETFVLYSSSSSSSSYFSSSSSSSSSSFSFSSSIGTTTHCGLWPVEQCPSMSATNSLHLFTPSTWRSLSTSSFYLFLGLPLLLVPSSPWVKIFLGILSSFILSRWPNQLILCPFIHFTIFSPLFISLVPYSSDFSFPHFHI